MNKKKLALLLALEMFLTACSYEKDTKKENNDVKEEKEVVIPVEKEEKKSVIELPTKTNDDLVNEKLEFEESYKVKFGYTSKDTELTLDNGETIKLSKYQRVIIHEEGNSTCFVETFDNDLGYLLKSDITIIPNTFVEVDLSSQILNLFVDGEIILTSNVVTGKDSTPTNPGYFKIESKSRNVYLTGPTWRNFVKYWMPFDGGRGLHDASWRSKSEFNENTHFRNGSHGCVNLPVDFAPKLYENVEKGTKVLIHK